MVGIHILKIEGNFKLLAGNLFVFFSELIDGADHNVCQGHTPQLPGNIRRYLRLRIAKLRLLARGNEAEEEVDEGEDAEGVDHSSDEV